MNELNRGFKIKYGKTCFLIVFSHNLCCIVVDEVDEVHKVSWGTSDVDKPFREIFSQLSIIWSSTPYEMQTPYGTHIH